MLKRKYTSKNMKESWNTWTSIAREGQEVIDELNKESELIVSKIDNLITSIKEPKAA